MGLTNYLEPKKSYKKPWQNSKRLWTISSLFCAKMLKYPHYIYIYIYIYINLPVDYIVRLPHPRSGDSKGQETFLATSADKQTRNYDTECSNHHPFLSTLRPKELSRRKMKWWAIYTNLPVDVLVRLPHPQSGDSQGQETFLYVYIYIYTYCMYMYVYIYILFHLKIQNLELFVNYYN